MVVLSIALLLLCPPTLRTEGALQVPETHRGKRNIGETHVGIASFYGERFRGRRTHTDDIFDPDKLTAACNILPLKTWVKVTNLRNNRAVLLWINDRMNPTNKRLIDVSARAARDLGFYARGLTRVKVEIVAAPSHKGKPIDK
jgi:rare lipoprotein A